MPITKVGKYSYRFQCMINKKRFSKTNHFYTETKNEINQLYFEWKIECEKGRFYKSNFTFQEFAELWVQENVLPEYSPQVAKNYICNLKNWIYPELGYQKLENITPYLLDAFISKLKNSKTKFAYRENHKLSNNTIEQIWKIVRTILHLAFMKGLITSNPCSRVRLELKKGTEPKKPHHWEITEYKKALDVLEHEKTNNAFVIEFALKTGLRRSELFALTWDDIDFSNGSISVNKTRQKDNGVMKIQPCKTESSIRTISIGDSIINKLKLLQYKSKNKYVFGDIDYDSVTAWFRGWIRKNNFTYITFHDLRHTHASLLLYKGVDIKTISERLGHSNISTTMNTYTHVLKELDKKASAAIEQI